MHSEDKEPQLGPKEGPKQHPRKGEEDENQHEHSSVKRMEKPRYYRKHDVKVVGETVFWLQD
jgi:hypothetical protein